MHDWTWETRTQPFAALDGPDGPGGPARFVVEQIGNATFRPDPDHGFVCRPPDGSAPIEVSSETLPSTDFASIPLFLSWFASRAGRHTPAALVHDQLVQDGTTTADRVRADDLFLALMERLDVPPVRRTTMWAAVSLATRWAAGGLTRLLLAAWGVVAAAGLTVLGVGLVAGRPLWVAVALLGPVPASLLWGGRWRAGLVAGFALPPVVLPALASWLGYATYWVTEQVVRRLLAILPHRQVEDQAPPESYRAL